MQHTEARKRLEERQAVLIDRTNRIEGDLRKARNPDFQESVSETENDEVLERLGDSERAELEEIRRALQRIDDGRYGTCDACGGDIGQPRLEALPHATRCVGCA